MAGAIKAVRPHVTIIGVEPTGAASMKAAVSLGRLIDLPSVRTIADTLSPRSVSQRTLDLTAQHVERIALVDDFAMLDGMRWLWREANQLVEPSGAAVMAAILTGAVDVSAYRCPVALICGGNAAADEVFYHYNAAAVAKGR